MPPLVSDIPNANDLNNQLTTLNAAIAALDGGSTVVRLTVSAPDPGDPTVFTSPIAVVLDPPISDANTLSTLSAALKSQAAAVTQELADLGFDTTTPAP